MVTHNQDFLHETCDEIWNVDEGRVSIEGPEPTLDFFGLNWKYQSLEGLQVFFSQKLRD